MRVIWKSRGQEGFGGMGELWGRLCFLCIRWEGRRVFKGNIPLDLLLEATQFSCFRNSRFYVTCPLLGSAPLGSLEERKCHGWWGRISNPIGVHFRHIARGRSAKLPAAEHGRQQKSWNAWSSLRQLIGYIGWGVTSQVRLDGKVLAFGPRD